MSAIRVTLLRITSAGRNNLGASQKTPSSITSPREPRKGRGWQHPLHNIPSRLRSSQVSFLWPTSENPPSTAASLSFPGCQAGVMRPVLQDIALLSANPLHGDNGPFKSPGHPGDQEGTDGLGSTGGCQLESFMEPRHHFPFLGVLRVYSLFPSHKKVS